LFGIAVTILLLATFPMEMLVVLSLAYLATIPLAIRRFKALQARDAAHESSCAVEAPSP
jgi:CDP-diacylglycerol--serine O-phosphatidyltransferase